MYVCFVERVLDAQVPILVVWKNAGWLIGGNSLGGPQRVPFSQTVQTSCAG